MAFSKNRSLLNLTTLEDRCCPSASVFAQDHTLFISTDVYSDTVVIRDNGHGQVSASIRGHDGIQNVALSGIDQIVMHLRGGHDWVDIESTAVLEHPLDVKIDMGQGANDRVHLNFNKGLGFGSLNVELFGTLGQSAINTTIGSLGHGTFDLADHMSESGDVSHLHISSLPNQHQRIYIG